MVDFKIEVTARFNERCGFFTTLTVTACQKTLLNGLQDAFRHRCDTPDATETCSGHSRIETRRIRVTTTLNDYPYFPYVAQVFAIERQVIEKKSARHRVKSLMV